MTERMPPVTHADVATVMCPVCHAESGASCFGGPSGAAFVHVARMWQAVKAAETARATVVAASITEYADCIARGEHRREED